MKKIGQIFLILLALVLMVGFGLCGLMGLSFGLVNNGGNAILLLALVGLLISGAFGYAIYKVIKAMRAPSQPSEQKAKP